MLRKNKLRVLTGGLLIASIFSLAACDTVKAKLPTKEQETKILAIDDKEAITHNNLGDLYDSLVPGDTSSAEKVLKEILLKYSYAKYGHFFDYIDAGSVAHKGIYSMLSASDDEVAQWVDDEKVSEFMIVGATNAEVAKLVRDLGNHIFEAVKKAMWANVTASSYQVRNVFIEAKFAKAQRTSHLYEIGQAALDSDKETIIDGSDTFENVEEYFADGLWPNYKAYVANEILPDLYRKIIVEDYLIDENYSNLGHTYARKVQYIALLDVSGYALATQRLVFAYSEFVLEADKTTMSSKAGVTVDDAHVKAFRDFHFLDRLYSGTYNDEDATEKAMAEAIYAEAQWQKKSITVGSETVDYYPATKAGAIVKDYSELEDNSRVKTGSTTDFTGNSAYTNETGLMLKLRETKAANSVTEGWYTSSELSSVISDLKTRLFKIQVANEVDSLDPEAALYDNSLSYGCYRQGSYYVVPQTRKKPTDEELANKTYHPYLVYDSGSSSWVILRVDEAVKGSKLGRTSTYDPSKEGSEPVTYNDFAKAGRREGKASQNEIVYTVASLMASSDTYVKAARQKVVEAMKIKYHDQSVYDYFSATFPELFN